MDKRLIIQKAREIQLKEKKPDIEVIMRRHPPPPPPLSLIGQPLTGLHEFPQLNTVKLNARTSCWKAALLLTEIKRKKGLFLRLNRIR